MYTWHFLIVKFYCKEKTVREKSRNPDNVKRIYNFIYKTHLSKL